MTVTFFGHKEIFDEIDGVLEDVLIMLLNIELRGEVYLFSNVFSVFLPLTDTFAEEILYLPVDRAKIVLCPGGYRGIELRGKP